MEITYSYKVTTLSCFPVTPNASQCPPVPPEFSNFPQCPLYSPSKCPLCSHAGCGPVGLLAIGLAKHMGATKMYEV